MSSSRANDPYDRKNIPILLKSQGVREKTVRSFSNLIDIKVSSLLDGFMPTCNC